MARYTNDGICFFGLRDAEQVMQPLYKIGAIKPDGGVGEHCPTPNRRCAQNLSGPGDSGMPVVTAAHSRGLAMKVLQMPTEELLATNGPRRWDILGRLGRGGQRHIADALVRAQSDVIVHVRLSQVIQMALAENKKVIEHFKFDRLNPTLDVSVHVWCPVGNGHTLDAVPGQLSIKPFPYTKRGVNGRAAKLRRLGPRSAGLPLRRP